MAGRQTTSSSTTKFYGMSRTTKQTTRQTSQPTRSTSRGQAGPSGYGDIDGYLSSLQTMSNQGNALRRGNIENARRHAAQGGQNAQPTRQRVNARVTARPSTPQGQEPDNSVCPPNLPTSRVAVRRPANQVAKKKDSQAAQKLVLPKGYEARPTKRELNYVQKDSPVRPSTSAQQPRTTANVRTTSAPPQTTGERPSSSATQHRSKSPPSCPAVAPSTVVEEPQLNIAMAFNEKLKEFYKDVYDPFEERISAGISASDLETELEHLRKQMIALKRLQLKEPAGATQLAKKHFDVHSLVSYLEKKLKYMRCARKKMSQPRRVRLIDCVPGATYQEKLRAFHKRVMADDFKLDDLSMLTKMKQIRSDIEVLNTDYENRDFNASTEGDDPMDFEAVVADMKERLDKLSRHAGKAFQKKLKYYHRKTLEDDEQLTEDDKEKKISTIRGSLKDLNTEYEYHDGNSSAYGDPRDINTVITDMTERMKKLSHQVVDLQRRRGPLYQVNPRRPASTLVRVGAASPQVYTPLSKSYSSVPDDVIAMTGLEIIPMERTEQVSDRRDLQVVLHDKYFREFYPDDVAERPKTPPPVTPPLEPRSGSFREPRERGTPFTPSQTGYSTEEVRSGLKYKKMVDDYQRSTLEDDSHLDETGKRMKIKEIRGKMANLDGDEACRPFNWSKYGVTPEKVGDVMEELREQMHYLTDEVAAEFQEKLRDYHGYAMADDSKLDTPGKKRKIKKLKDCITALREDYTAHDTRAKSYKEDTTDLTLVVQAMANRMKELTRKVAERRRRSRN